jgi:hypothetical protein
MLAKIAQVSDGVVRVAFLFQERAVGLFGAATFDFCNTIGREADVAAKFRRSCF